MTIQQVRLNHFKPSEFDQTDFGGENWYPHMSLELLYRLDALRGCWGEPIGINRVVGAIGRRDDSSSDHNFSKWGEVRGTDVNINLDTSKFTKLAAKKVAMMRVSDFITDAQCAGFNAIGFYPDSNTKFFHLGVRNQDKISTWGRVNGKYVSLAAALEDYRGQL